MIPAPRRLRDAPLRTRLVVFLAALLAAVQGVAFVLVDRANEASARDRLASELEVGERVFARLLAQREQQLAQAARVLAADFAFRSAMASSDAATIRSALENHAGRIGADVSLLVGLDGGVRAAAGVVETPLPGLEALLERAAGGATAGALALHAGTVHQWVAVPVLAPLPIAWVVLGFPLADTVGADLRQLTSLHLSVLSIRAGAWTAHFSTLPAPLPAALASALGERVPAAADLRVGDEDFATRSLRLELAGAAPLLAVLQRPLADARAAASVLARTLAVLALASLALSIVGAMAVARGVTRPLSSLTEAALRLKGGDYATPITVARHDEVGVLAGSLEQMRSGIAEREREILRLAYQDTLTGLPNRTRFQADLATAIAGQGPPSGQIAVILLDIDRFKAINEVLGHEAGDHVIAECGRRLGSLLGPADRAARLSADEFALLLAPGDEARVAAIIAGLQATLAVPFAWGEHALDLGASLGIAHWPGHGRDAATLMRCADVALQTAKARRCGQATWSPDHDVTTAAHLGLLGELRRALRDGELRLWYQPQLDLADGTVRSVEALLRWQHPTRGLVPPGEFIPFAEQTGHIRQLTRWALAEGIGQCGRWLAAGHRISVSINLSVRDLGDRDLPAQVDSLLREQAVPGELLCLEITESGFLEDPARALAAIRELAALGVRLAIDDYGTGYSSLAYLMQLPLNELKIDRSFVLRMTREPGAATIVRSTIELGHSLGLKVVAEGVEDAVMLAALAGFGCDLAQGYHVGRPVPAADLVLPAAGRRRELASPARPAARARS